MNRWRDWWDQAERDLRHAHHSLEHSDYEWSAFAAQQAAEKGVKALILGLGGDPWGHSVSELVGSLPRERAPEPVLEAARRLDKHYLPARYPNGLPAGFPGQHYSREEAEDAIANAQRVLEFCRGALPG